MDQKTLETWLEGRLEEAPAPAAILLVHQSLEPSGMGADLQDIVQRETPREGDHKKEATRIAAKIWSAASTHASAFGGQQQRYKVVAESDLGIILGSMPVVIGMLARGLGGIDHSPIEVATPAGLLGQLMRHNEATMRTLTEALGAVLGPLVATNEQQQRRLNAYEEQRIEILEKLENLHTLQHERDMEVIRLGAQTERKNKLTERLAVEVIPRLASQFFDGPAGAIAAAALGGSAKKTTNGEASASGGGTKTGSESNGQSNGHGEKNVAYYQSQLRYAFKVLDRDAIYDLLPELQKKNLDGLLGMAEDPKDVSDYKQRFMAVMGELPREVLDQIMETMTSKHHAEAAVFADLFGFGSSPTAEAKA